MERWILLVMVYAWLGFTLGYFFHKWMERNVFRRNAAESAKAAGNEGSSQEPP